MATITEEVVQQRRYYAGSASAYDAQHLRDGGIHEFALAFLGGVVDHLQVQSLLDVGSGTGRVLRHFKVQRPDINAIGVEPVAELRAVGHRHGLTESQLLDGDATSLQFSDGHFDLACSFGVLHHIKRPELAVAEMLRVSRRAIFISDSNNFGQGTFLSRSVKQIFDALGMWRAVDFIKTRGKGYTWSEGDGVAYSYSVFNNLAQVRKRCSRVHLLSTTNSGVNLYRSSGHVALLGIK